MYIWKSTVQEVNAKQPKMPQAQEVEGALIPGREGTPEVGRGAVTSSVMPSEACGTQGGVVRGALLSDVFAKWSVACNHQPMSVLRAGVRVGVFQSHSAFDVYSHTNHMVMSHCIRSNIFNTMNELNYTSLWPSLHSITTIIIPSAPNRILLLKVFFYLYLSFVFL